MRIEVHNVRARITECTAEELAWVREHLTYSKKTYIPQRKRQTGTKVCLVSVKDGTFPAGLVPVLDKGAARQKPPIVIRAYDQRIVPARWDTAATKRLSFLRPDQTEVLRTCYKHERGLLDLATAYGKTIVSVALVESIPIKWVFLVASKSLLNQTVEKYESFTGKVGEVGVIGDGKWVEGERFTVASLQTLHRNLAGKGGDFMRRMEGVIFDEVHQAGADTYRAVVEAAENAYWRYGVSGTPLSRSDQKNLVIVGAFGPVIHRIKPSEVVDAGITAKPNIVMYDLWQESERVTWQGAEREMISKSVVRNKLLTQIAVRAPKPHMMFVKTIQHGRTLLKMLGQAGLRVEFVWGNKNTAQREAACERLIRNDIDVLIASVIFQEGLDLPDLRSGSVACGGQCLGPDEDVLAYDGTLVKAKDVKVGDFLMGPDSKPRTVLGTTTGVGPMFRVIPKRGKPWTCNDAHILTVSKRYSKDGRDEIVDLPVSEFAGRQRRQYRQFSVGVDFPEQDPLPVDPYFVGVWFGDGTKSLATVQVTTMDRPIVEMLEHVAKDNDLKLVCQRKPGGRAASYSITKSRGGNQPNRFLNLLRSVVGDAKELPRKYLTASRENRAQFLAGLLDTDGSVKREGYEITQVRRLYADGICFLANSLGLKSTLHTKRVNGALHWRVTIVGDCSFIPVRIGRKRVRKRRSKNRPLHTEFVVEPIGVDKYAGFQVDGDGRFLLGDFTVTHNSTIATLQRLGRLMRKTEDKEEFYFYDIFDQGQKWTEKHAKARKKSYEKAGFPVELIHADELLLAS